MKRDIVERLRARKGFWLNGASWMMGNVPDGDCQEAANEIERLRALINEQSHGETYGRRSGGAKERLF